MSRAWITRLVARDKPREHRQRWQALGPSQLDRLDPAPSTRYPDPGITDTGAVDWAHMDQVRRPWAYE